MKRRVSLIATGIFLLIWAMGRIRQADAGQGAVSWSRPGQEDLTFWINHNGLEQVDVEGEVGFGDMARVLMRRRANREAFHAIRDRFVFRTRKFEDLRMPEIARAILDSDGFHWEHTPPRLIVAAGRIVNIPLIITNRTPTPAACSMGAVPPNAAAGYFAKLTHTHELRVRCQDEEIITKLDVDVRPLVPLEIELSEPARVYLTAADGLAYTPKGFIHRYAPEPAEPYFHAEGHFRIDLPAGETRIEAVRGLEYTLESRTIQLEPGKPAHLRLAPRRWADMATKHWYSADAHIHANYTADHHQVVTPEDMRLLGQAEDLNYANLMVANSFGAFVHDEGFFEGRPHKLSTSGHLLYWGEEMRNAALYGHMCFFGLKSLVHPIYSGFRDTPNFEDYPANYFQAKATRAQGGAVTYAHPGYATTMEGASARELPVDAALGEVDALDVLSNNPEEVGMELWYRLLNCGLHVATPIHSPTSQITTFQAAGAYMPT